MVLRFSCGHRYYYFFGLRGGYFSIKNISTGENFTFNGDIENLRSMRKDIAEEDALINYLHSNLVKIKSQKRGVLDINCAFE